MPRKPYIAQTRGMGKTKKTKKPRDMGQGQLRPVTKSGATQGLSQARNRPKNPRAKTTGLENVTGKRIKNKPAGTRKPKQPQFSHARATAAVIPKKNGR